MQEIEYSIQSKIGSSIDSFSREIYFSITSPNFLESELSNKFLLLRKEESDLILEKLIDLSHSLEIKNKLMNLKRDEECYFDSKLLLLNIYLIMNGQ